MTLKTYIDLLLKKIEFYITQQKTTYSEKRAMELNKHFCKDK